MAARPAKTWAQLAARTSGRAGPLPLVRTLRPLAATGHANTWHA